MVSTEGGVVAAAAAIPSRAAAAIPIRVASLSASSDDGVTMNAGTTACDCDSRSSSSNEALPPPPCSRRIEYNRMHSFDCLRRQQQDQNSEHRNTLNYKSCSEDEEEEDEELLEQPEAGDRIKHNSVNELEVNKDSDQYLSSNSCRRTTDIDEPTTAETRSAGNIINRNKRREKADGDDDQLYAIERDSNHLNSECDQNNGTASGNDYDGGREGMDEITKCDVQPGAPARQLCDNDLIVDHLINKKDSMRIKFDDNGDAMIQKRTILHRKFYKSVDDELNKRGSLNKNQCVTFDRVFRKLREQISCKCMSEGDCCP